MPESGTFFYTRLNNKQLFLDAFIKVKVNVSSYKSAGTVKKSVIKIYGTGKKYEHFHQKCDFNDFQKWLPGKGQSRLYYTSAIHQL